MAEPAEHGHENVRRPIAWDKVPQYYIDRNKKLIRLQRRRIAEKLLIPAIFAALILATLVWLSVADKAHTDNYKQAFYGYFHAGEQFIVCGPVYGAFISHPNGCPQQQSTDSEGTQATNWLLVGIGLLQFFVYWRQARILTRQAAIAKDTLGFLATQDRPYILVSDLLVQWADISGLPEPQRELTARLKNFGRSPAIVHKIEFEEPSSHRRRSRPVYWSLYEESFVIAPGAFGVRYGFPIQDDPKDHTSPTSASTLYFYVRVRYSDLFGNYWVTSFAFRLDDFGKIVSRVGGSNFNTDTKDSDPDDD